MKTEFDNTENEALSIARIKSRFFAQYWGVKCFEWKPENSIGVQIEEVNSQIEKYYNCGFILLKHLSQITDEECIFIGTNILAIPTGLINYEHKVVYVKNVITNQLNKSITHIGKDNVIYSNFYLLDFLRSKGYAVPFMKYSVDELILFGWMQLR